tara:strand:+ start:45 stop:1064 length:1020 start_codon:yes stop_codon:yes gene_type:complete
MAGYTKLFGSILESTVWLESPPVKVVWITMLAMADRDGIVEASVPGLAKRAGVERAYCEQALNIFLAPDPDSRTPAFEGRRIEVVAGGWQLLNYDLYRHRASVDDAKAKAAARQRRHRERQKAPPVTDEVLLSQPVTVEPLLNVTVTQNNPIAEEEEEEEGKEERTERAGAVQVPRAPVAQPTPVAPRPGAPLHATHRAHAACGRVCVPATLHQQFVQALNRDTADAELRAWYSTVNTTWTDGVHKDDNPGADAFRFWRDRINEHWPPHQSPAAPTTRHARAHAEPEPDADWGWSCPHVDEHLGKHDCHVATLLGRPLKADASTRDEPEPADAPRASKN